MSRLSNLFRRIVQPTITSGGTDLIKSLVQFLEGTDIAGPQRKEIALRVLKTLHINLGEAWDDLLANELSGAIEYVLADIRKWAEDHLPHAAENPPDLIPPPPVVPPAPPQS